MRAPAEPAAEVPGPDPEIEPQPLPTTEDGVSKGAQGAIALRPGEPRHRGRIRREYWVY